MISTDAFAYRGGGRTGVHRGGVYHSGAYRGGVYRGAPVARGVAVGVGTATVGAAAAGVYYAPRCGILSFQYLASFKGTGLRASLHRSLRRYSS